MSFKSVFVPASKSYDFGEEKKQIDGDDFAQAIDDACNTLDIEGYKVLSITPINDGHYEEQYRASYGFSCTSGVIITAQNLFQSEET